MCAPRHVFRSLLLSNMDGVGTLNNVDPLAQHSQVLYLYFYITLNAHPIHLHILVFTYTLYMLTGAGYVFVLGCSNVHMWICEMNRNGYNEGKINNKFLFISHARCLFLLRVVC